MLTVKPTLVIIENSSHIYFENYSHFQIMKLNYIVNTSAVSTQFQSYDDRVKRSKVVHACMKTTLTLGPAKHEEVAVYVVNKRIPSVCRIARIVKQ